MHSLQNRYENKVEARAKALGFASYADRFDREQTFREQMIALGGTRYVIPQKFLDLGDVHPDKGKGKKGAGKGGPKGPPSGKGKGKAGEESYKGGGWGRPRPPTPPRPPNPHASSSWGARYQGVGRSDPWYGW